MAGHPSGSRAWTQGGKSMLVCQQGFHQIGPWSHEVCSWACWGGGTHVETNFVLLQDHVAPHKTMQP